MPPRPRSQHITLRLGPRRVVFDEDNVDVVCRERDSMLYIDQQEGALPGNRRDYYRRLRSGMP